MPQLNILITGATGFIGAQVAKHALEAGHNVKLSIRRETSIEKLRRVFADHLDQLQFTLVSDICAPGAFDDALQDVDQVIHLASPLPGTHVDLITPAVEGTISLLQSGLQRPAIKKVIVTASVLSLIPLGETTTDGLLVTENIGKAKLEFDSSRASFLKGLELYHASKLASYAATLDFIEEKKPHFSVVTMHPVFVFGQNVLQDEARQLSGTNAMLFGSLYSPSPLFAPFRGVHVVDVADAHIKALSLTDHPHSAYLLAAKQRSWDEVITYIESEFPSAGIKVEAKSGVFWNVDTRRAKADLGFDKWIEMEDQVKDVLSQQLKLRSQ